MPFYKILHYLDTTLGIKSLYLFVLFGFNLMVGELHGPIHGNPWKYRVVCRQNIRTRSKLYHDDNLLNSIGFCTFSVL